MSDQADKKPSRSIACDKSSCINNIDASHYLAIFLWLGWYCFYPALLIALPFLWVYAKIVLTFIVGIILISALTPIKKDKQPQWTEKLGKWMISKASEYFGLKLIIEDKDELAKQHPAIFVLEPHDVLPIGIFAFSDHIGYLPNHRCTGCISSACFAVPLMRHFFTWASAGSVDKKNIESLLSTGTSVTVCPGGVQEVTMLSDGPDKEVILYMRSRFGLVRLALKFGVPLVPSFCFGQRALFRFWVPKWKWAHALGRQIGFAPMLFTGKYR